jgi:hypothetical protein
LSKPGFGVFCPPEPRHFDPNNSEAVSYWLQCIGAAAVADLLPEVRVPRWLQISVVNAAASWQQRQLEDDEGTAIDQHNIQLWVGLRESARMIQHRTTLTVSADLGERVLDLWRAAEPTYERAITLNAAMITWLESRSRARWALLPQNPFIHEILDLPA